MRVIKKIVGGILQFVFSFFSIKENTVFFETCNGEVKDQLKAVYDYANENKITTLKFYWAITKGNDISDIKKEEVVYKRTINYYYRLMTCKYWIRTHSVDNIVKKRRGQVYIQMWHGPGAIKKEGFDLGIEDDGLPLYHTREWDYYIATDDHSASYIVTATHFNAKIYTLGSARSDYLYHATNEKRKEIRENLGIQDNEVAIIYAPTFRDRDLQKEVVDLPIKSICNLKGVKVILRLHPFIKNKLNISDYGENVIDGNVFSEMNDLLIASDAMITDYSSIAIDYSILRKPTIYYCYDLEEYNVERGFYYDYLNRLSGPMVRCESELEYWVKNLDKISQDYQTQAKAYYELYNKYNDGHVCERFLDLLISGEFKERDI